MRIYLTCIRCPSKSGDPPALVTAYHLRDTNLYELTCPAGHQTTTCLQHQKFEILFDVGAYAIVDGYYREAVSSFTSAMERFYEFYVEVHSLRRGLSQEAYAAAWKQVSNQSERQLGAFVFVHLLETGVAPKLLSSDEIGLRNAVIHKGRIPSRAEALEYGERVRTIIAEELEVLKRTCHDAVQAVVVRHLIRLRKSVTTADVSTMSFGTALSLSFEREKQPTLVEWVNMLTAQRVNRPVFAGDA